jgi:hypothetical protein
MFLLESEPLLRLHCEPPETGRSNGGPLNFKMTPSTKASAGKSTFRLIFTDIHFWVPVIVLFLGAWLLAIFAITP